MKIRPLQNRIIVEPILEDEKLQSGLFIASKPKYKEQGKIIAVGPGKIDKNKLIPMSVQVGDTVLFAVQTGSIIKIDNKECFVLREDDIIGIVKS
jgi:chaperonin GroES